MLNIGPQELLVVLLIALIVVGPKRLPELGRTLGRGLREFRKVQDEVRDTLRFDVDQEPPSFPEPAPHGPSAQPAESPVDGSADVAEPDQTD